MPDQKDFWLHEIKATKIAGLRVVRDLVTRHAESAKRHISGQTYLGVANTLLPIDFAANGALAKKLGIKTGKTENRTIAMPPGAVIVAALCSLAARGYPLQEIQQADHGCCLNAVLPSNLYSWEGRLYVAIYKHQEEIRVEAMTHIEGQIYDWGRSKRVLRDLFLDLDQVGTEILATFDN